MPSSGTNPVPVTPAQRRALVEAPLPQIHIYGSSYQHGGVQFSCLNHVFAPKDGRRSHHATDVHDYTEFE